MEFEMLFPGIWRNGDRIFTKNLLPGDSTYSKSIARHEGAELREWNPFRSKPAAAIMKGIKEFPLAAGMKVLYLGISFGQTATFFSDIVGRDGIIYGIEISERCFNDLNPVAEKRGNIVPVVADARSPEDYSWIEPVDLVYQDVASDQQSEILIRNCRAFLRPGGHAMVAIKARSIDVVKDPKKIYAEELEKLGKEFGIIEKKQLDPFEKDHMFVIMKKKA
jgi:fibrillarin-like pre-rRNA processing protein